MSEWFDSDREEEAASGGVNAGKILTSTKWSQYGTVYVSVDGTQTALSGYTYNKFCPNYSEGSRALTGCSNTADSQILYYWIEKGYDLSLAVTTANYFKIKDDSKTYYVSDTANAGEGTLTEINTILASKSRIGNGDFIAALNFFCGVNNHSSYGSSTSTSWSYLVSATGKCAASFVAAGFDSYYFIARKASGSVPGLFFTGDNGLNAVGLSIMRENLDYGEPIRLGIPNHAIYMDGYRLNAESGEYEYHLNYGWGKNSSSTKWYTVKDLEEESITYVTIDLSPDVKVRVSNAREDYYGGSFLRGMERINHIVNDKSTTFAFDSELAGETITLSAAAKISSNVDVEFKNIGVSLATAANELFNSARGMSFDISGGSLIVDAAGTPYAIRETGNSAVNVTIRNGFIYSGNMAGGISAVQSSLAPDGGYSFGDFDADFYASVTGYAVKSGSAADTVTLESGAALFGRLDLGTGKNILDIGAGSLFYGAFAGTADTLTVNFTIDNSAAIGGATAVFADSGSGQAFYTATGGVLNLEFSSPGQKACSYDLLCGIDAGIAKLFSVVLTVQGNTVTLDAKHNEYSYFSLTREAEKLVLEYAPSPPEVLSVTPDIAGPTRDDVTLTATFSDDTVLALYSIDGGKWKKLPDSGVLVMDENGTVYFRACNAMEIYSEIVEFTVDWIDRTPPEKPTAGANVTAPTNGNVTVTAVFGDDTARKQYSLDGSEWRAYTSGVVMQDNGAVYFRGIDAAGNVSEVTEYTVSNIDRIPPEKPTASANVTAPTNGDVTVTATFGADTATKQYSMDGSEWLTYTSGVVMQDNGTVYFRGIDAAGNVSEAASHAVTNIDRTPPAITLIGDNVSAVHQTELSAAADDGSALYYRVGGGEWRPYTSPIAVGTNADYEFKATDAAGNTGYASIAFAHILTEFPEKPVGTPDTQSWSPTGAERYVVEYSTDDFEHVISVTVNGNGIDSPELPSGTYQWRVRSENDEQWTQGENIVADNADTDPRVVRSDADGNDDVFFTAANGTWGGKYAAQHLGASGDWNGTNEIVSLAGRGRIGNFYFGSTDANTLLLTDAANGDALFVDDIFTKLPAELAEHQSRLAGIGEIRAGAGDDVVDLTSRRFEYVGGGLTVRGGAGNDVVWANRGENRLFGDSGSDRLVGASGNDVIVGGIGNDSMHGGGGNDVFTFCGDWGVDTVEQLGGGSVTLWFASGSSDNWNAATLTYADGENSVTVTGVTADRVTLKFGDDGSERYAGLAATGAFAAYTSENIFEERGKGILASR